MACRFVNDEGKVVERFLGPQHVESCTTIALKESLVGMLSSQICQSLCFVDKGVMELLI